MYEEYLKRREKFVESMATEIQTVNETEVPQHVLWKKETTDKLTTDKAKCVRIDGTFYFTEPLVNKLMYLAYLDGSKAFDKHSYRQGWEDCFEDVQKRLGICPPSEEE